ncbi:MAG: hydrolase, partial [Actinobacteria bacterium]|nr:hydrolase [Actinomycetota bacterium]
MPRRRASALLVLVLAAASLAGMPEQASAATKDTLPGIDVSHWQGKIDWTKVAADGVTFAIVKATEGRNYVDPMYATNAAGATANGIAVGAYHFASPGPQQGDATA